ncbi:MAG TPA: hypothetical protein VJ385_18580 [Fibrobacteria bacterium]|nr:hypothetical protein [Fibrobacteria bacterium]
MKKLTILTSLFLAAWAGAKICDQGYHLQEAYQIILKGNSSSSLQPQGASVKLGKAMGNATVLHDETEYRIITDWAKGTNCDIWEKRDVNFAYRKKGETQFSTRTDGYFVKLDSVPFTHKTPGWDDYWFGFASTVSGTTVNLYDAVGKNVEKPTLHTWYGNAVLKQTLRSAEGADSGSRTYYYSELTSHPDSAVLSKLLANGFKPTIQSEPKDLLYTVQLIRITYDSVETPATRTIAAKQKSSGFQASQTGSLVLIQLGEKAAHVSEPLSLYGMMGNKVATLHPTGYLYQWNGKTSAGAEAPIGVYFVQSGNRILGKFFYTR